MSPGVWGQLGKHSKVVRPLIIKGGVVGKDGEEEKKAIAKGNEKRKEKEFPLELPERTQAYRHFEFS